MTVSMTPLLARIRDELVQRHRAHTILLYGSRANGTEQPDSDYDIAAFAPIDVLWRDTRAIDGQFLDVFLYPEAVLTNPSVEYFKLRGSAILLQRGNAAIEFLHALNALHEKGPPPLPEDERAVLKNWARKMSVRLKRNDIEGNYRRVWLLTALLEDYFQLRGHWFEGPKRSFLWLAEHDRPTLAAFDRALLPNAPDEAIEALVARVVDDGHAPP